MNGSKVLARRIHLAVAWIFLVAILIQVFLIGLYLFAGGSLEPHRSFGYSILFVALAVLLTALWARVPRRDGWIAAGVLGLYIVQTSLPEFKASASAIAALVQQDRKMTRQKRAILLSYDGSEAISFD